MALSEEATYYDLGSYHRAVSTGSTITQTWFNRGLIWLYGFNHEEATACFERAIAADSTCAMAYWGLAYALGPNYNKPWDVFDEREFRSAVKRTHDTASQAKTHAAAGVTPTESALIDALQHRYPKETPTPTNGKDCAIWNRKYADAMQAVYSRFSTDMDVACLFADALMNLTPWALWDIDTGRPAANARTLEAKEVLERALRQDGAHRHPGLLHLYIHMMEMSGTPESALVAADHLRGLVPDSGHLNHMPSHLDILCGDYRRAIASNSEAIRADAKYLARAGPLNFYSLYRSHNYHFRLYAAMFAGLSRVALDTAAELESTIPEELLRIESPPMADWLEAFLGMRVHVLIRFGLWDEIIGLQLPHDDRLYCFTTAMIHYAKGVAYAATGRIAEALTQKDLFRRASEAVPRSRVIFHNPCIDLLPIAAAMLDGELEYRQGNFYSAFEHLRRAIALDDSLSYDEPWEWMQPTRHAYGALLLEQGLVEDAAQVYRADLGFDDSLPRARQHLNNVWALHGYHECLVKLGRSDEARVVETQLRLALAVADVPVRSSCFCRLGPADTE